MKARELFATNIRYLRETTQMSLTEVARGLGISHKRYAQWEYGNGAPGYDLLVEVADFFDVGIDNLLTIDMRNGINSTAN